MANKWTEEQLRAIEIEGNHVLVSAGAGSGKTAVLSERVLRKVKSGISISKLLILTFTKAAAQEMKERIRKKLIEEHLDSEVQLIDNAYITTFDSFSLSVVRKYHYILGISKEIEISDAVLLDIIKRDLLDSILEEKYQKEDSNFKDFVCQFSVKDDKNFADLLIELSNKLELKYDRQSFLKQYMENYYSHEHLDSLVLEYVDRVKKQVFTFQELITDLERCLEEKKLEKVMNATKKMMSADTYSSIREAISSFELPRAVGYSEEAKEIQEQIKIVRDELKKLCVYEDEEKMKEEILATYADTEVIIDLLQLLDHRFSQKKREENLYDFNDISHLAIKLVEEHKDIREEIKNSFQEILIDEYQDTSDNQEAFISLISDHNVYMVGDLKQSIYRFRNANPYIFKKKYDAYREDSSQGEKIDLNKNFRSREEVLDNINILFQDIMDEDIGGANYQKEHLAVFGNTSYQKEGRTNQNYNVRVLTYQKEKDMTDVEQEAFIIARDIKKKVEEHYQIFDKDQKILRDATYHDFVILLDKKKNFDLYKKIFEYVQVPLTIYREEEIHNTDDFLVIYHLLRLVLFVYHEQYGPEFRYSFTAIARSYLFRYSDQEIFSIFHEKSFLSTEIVKIALCIKQEVSYLPVHQLFHLILSKYHYYEKLLTVTNLTKCEKCVEYLNHLIYELGEKSYTIEDVMYYLDKVLERDYCIQYDQPISIQDSVSIMTIHKSKGLEFPICYFSDLQNSFNMKEQKQKVIFDTTYGIILPDLSALESKDTILKFLYRERDSREEISERIRLFYVALTRCKEQLIFVCPEVVEYAQKEGMVSCSVRKKYSSFYSILKSVWYKLIPYIESISPEEVSYSREYLYQVKSSALHDSNSKKLNVQPLSFSLEMVEERHFSKNSHHIQTKEEQEVMAFGREVHKVLEEIDFRNPRLELFSLSPYMKEKVLAFLNSDLIQKHLNASIYKEYEFIEERENSVFHGIIDLMIEEEDLIYLIDYKLKHVEDEEYFKQLKGYQRYIEKVTNKKVELYLYSILDEEFKSLSSVYI